MRRIGLAAAALVPAVAALVVGGVAHAEEALTVEAVSASGDDGNVPENTLDGDLDTRWSDEGDGVWIRYDLGSDVTLGSVAVAWHEGDERRATFAVQTSADGEDWDTAVSRRSTGGETREQETHDFADRDARYLRVVGYGNTDNDWTSITEVDIFGADGGGGDDPDPGGDCEYPADVLDLTGWKVQLPIGDEEDPDEVTQPDLGTYAVDPWFRATEACDGIQFRSAVNGVTTGGSSYPRSELREMTADGSDETEWSSNDGTHTMVIRQAITDVPNDKPDVVAGQIHGGDDDVSVFRLEGSNLYVTKGDTSDHHLITDDYELGTVFEAKFVVSDGEIRAYYNGELETTIEADFDTGYFKAGAYTQANCDRSDPCDDSNYGQVIIHDIEVTHS
ncbi:MAG TPA: polysaccharide lyase family 7 protein [Actinophytocola sp.]|nr:polysaccharide lyase family 7 protein [Actinophytocola sp.]